MTNLERGSAKLLKWRLTTKVDVEGVEQNGQCKCLLMDMGYVRSVRIKGVVKREQFYVVLG